MRGLQREVLGQTYWDAESGWDALQHVDRALSRNDSDSDQRIVRACLGVSGSLPSIELRAASEAPPVWLTHL